MVCLLLLIDSWSVECISESLPFCFNFSKAGFDKWLPQNLIQTYGWLNVLDESEEVKGKKTLLPLFLFVKSLETGNARYGRRAELPD